jgi:hypothetical protein
MGHGVEIQRAAIFDEPEWRAHSLPVSAIALQVQILSAGELGELVIAHILRNAFFSKREEIQPGAYEGDQQNDRY